ncbi:hypothetical protein ABEB36_001646 [Hypothenemus hampei]|uniref:Protein FAM98A n=1 Tax=Hypothenemus hampei TaxID=57062 RepID=A0ABD1FFA0_HYPHA
MSRLEDKILKGLEDIGYTGPLLKLPQLEAAVKIGQKHEEFTKLVSFLTNEIKTLLNIDEEVNAISSPEDSVVFVMEITSFLKELNCPYSSLTQGLVSERLQNYSERLLLLDYLLTELMAARILHEKKPNRVIELKLHETPEGADMRQILQTLRFTKPPANINIKQLFDKLDITIPLVLKKANADLIGKPMFNGSLSDKQWEILRGVQNDLNNEYKIRREMLLTRLDVTIQSFQWSDRTKGKEHLFEKVYHDNRKLLPVEPNVDISDLISARTEMAIIEKTSNASVRRNTQTPLNKVIIGQVPDRGGRSWEQAPPPPEMPAWQQTRTPTGNAPAPRGGGNRGNSNTGGRGGGSFTRNDNRQNDFSNQASGPQGRNSGNFHSPDRNFSGRGDFDNQRRYGGNNQYDNRGGGAYGGNYNRGGYGNRGGNYNYNYNRRDSGGYSGQDFQQNKRPKTYDNFQANKTTYADQYVHENQHNQQYQRGGRSFHRGRSSYHRGGGYR